MYAVIGRAVSVSVLVCVTWVASADAQTPGGGEKQRVQAGCSETGCDSSAVVTQRLQGAKANGPSEWTCAYTRLDIPAGMTVYDDETGLPVITTGKGHWTQRDCAGPGGVRTAKVMWVVPTAPTDVRNEAMAHLDLPQPIIEMSPKATWDQVVNVRTLLWTDPGIWRTRVSTVSVPGVSVTVRAEPVALDWDMGTADGKVHCTGPGVPWNQALSEEQQDTSCSFLYRHSSAGQPGLRYPVTATLSWHVTWSVSGAPGGGDLGIVSRTASTSLRVIEIQTVGY